MPLLARMLVFPGLLTLSTAYTMVHAFLSGFRLGFAFALTGDPLFDVRFTVDDLN